MKWGCWLHLSSSTTQIHMDVLTTMLYNEQNICNTSITCQYKQAYEVFISSALLKLLKLPLFIAIQMLFRALHLLHRVRPHSWCIRWDKQSRRHLSCRAFVPLYCHPACTDKQHGYRPFPSWNWPFHSQSQLCLPRSSVSSVQDSCTTLQ